jgi:hypothetical protein
MTDIQKELRARSYKRLVRIITLNAVFFSVLFFWFISAKAEDLAPYRSISFEWEYGDYAAASGFYIYKEGLEAPIAVVKDRTARTYDVPMQMVVGQNMCFVMAAFGVNGEKSGMSKSACILVPLPGVEMFLAFPKTAVK